MEPRIPEIEIFNYAIGALMLDNERGDGLPTELSSILETADPLAQSAMRWMHNTVEMGEDVTLKTVVHVAHFMGLDAEEKSAIREQRAHTPRQKQKRNALCACGSKRKYKKCCGASN